MINNLFSYLWERRQKQTNMADPESSQSPTYRLPKPLNTVNHFLRSHFLVPAAFKSYHQRLYYGFKIPSRMESIIVFVYWALNLILCSVNYRAFYGNV